MPILPLLLADDYFADAVGTCLAAWRRVVAGAAQNGIPTPAFSSSLAYYDGIRAERLPAALIQAQRDFFGAHTYRRVDKDGTYHTEWTGDRSESNGLRAGDRRPMAPRATRAVARAGIGWPGWPAPALRNELRARDFADRAGANGMVPNGGVAVFFATGSGEPVPVRAVAPTAGTAGRTTAGVRDRRPGRHRRASAADHVAAARLRPRQRAAGEPRRGARRAGASCT